MQTLLDAAPRYARAIHVSGLGFEAPAKRSSLDIIERIEGNSTTDFGAPARLLSTDWDPLETSELERRRAILAACWGAFDRAAASGVGKELRKGPRGGGRELAKIIDHVAGAEISYLGRLGWKVEDRAELSWRQRLAYIRAAGLEGLAQSAAGKLPREGPRGGQRWPARFYLRRSAWHLLDHAWEIEDRVL